MDDPEEDGSDTRPKFVSLSASLEQQAQLSLQMENYHKVRGFFSTCHFVCY